jgi:hypothetical protein
VAIQVFERVYDARVGVLLELAGQALPSKKRWAISYTGQYGFKNDPAKHKEVFPTLAEAMVRWKQLVDDYRQRALGVNRLKAFRKAGFPKYLENYEATIYEKGGLMAALSSQGPKTRRKRIWVINASAPNLGLPAVTKMIVPYQAYKQEELAPYAIRVPLSRLPEELNKAWDTFVSAYLATR